MFKNSLKNKITFSIALTIIITSSSLAIIIFYIVRNNLYDIESKAILKNTIDESDKINQLFNNSIQVVKTVSVQPEIASFLNNPLKINPQLIETILHHYNIANQYSVIYLLNKDGNTLVSTDHLLLGNNFSFRNYFINAKNGLEIVDFNIGGITKEAGFYFSAPVFDNNNSVIGIVATKLKPEVISGIFRINEFTTHDHFTITDLHGVILATNDHDLSLYSSFGPLPSNVLQKFILENRYGSNQINSVGLNNVQKIIDQYSSPLTTQIYDKKIKLAKIIGISRIDNQPFYLIYESETSFIDAIVQQNAVILILTALFISTITLVSLNWSVSIFLYPFTQLKKFATGVSLGNFNQVLSIKTNDEIQDLADILNKMTFSLRTSYKEMEDKIQSRTEDLSSKVGELEFSKKAIINLLEDVEKEKEFSQQNAGDLQKFKLAVDSASDQIIITDPDGTILYVNPATEKNTGYSYDELIGNNPRLWGKQMSLEFFKILWSQIKTSKISFLGEITNKHKDDSKYIAQVQIHPIIDKNGHVIFFVGIERDITKAKEVETMKNDFISVASHQLRTPLGSMRWNLEMLLAGDMGKLSKLVKDTIQEIYGSDTRMLSLVNDLLNVSRIDQGRIENIPINTNIIPIIEDSIKEMEFMSNKKKLKINFDKKNISELLAFVDPKRFREVMQNILSNAVKYNRESGSIKIKIAQNSKETNITVSDTGMGISKKDQEKIFAKFFRASNAVLGETEGSGLGLFVVKSFVESWGGTVSFSSEENIGTTIYIKLLVKKNKNVH